MYHILLYMYMYVHPLGAQQLLLYFHSKNFVSSTTVGPSHTYVHRRYIQQYFIFVLEGSITPAVQGDRGRRLRPNGPCYDSRQAVYGVLCYETCYRYIGTDIISSTMFLVSPTAVPHKILKAMNTERCLRCLYKFAQENIFTSNANTERSLPART